MERKIYIMMPQYHFKFTVDHLVLYPHSQVQSVLPITLALGCGNMQVSFHWRKLTFPLPAAIKCQKTFSEGWDFMPISSSMLWLLSGLAYITLMHAITISVHSCVQMACCIWKNIVSLKSPPACGSYNLPALFSIDLPEPSGERCDIDIFPLGLSILKSPILCTLLSCGSPCSFPSTVRRGFPKENW